MGTVQRPNRLILLVILGLSAVLAACSSGGGKGGSSSGNRDTIPDSFTLTTPSGVDPTKVGFGTAVVSAPVKITGINAPAPVSIQGGEFKIESGGFTSTASTISNGQSIQVRVQTPIKAEQTATAILTIGGIEASFTVTTGPDTTPPEVSILFPPPASMTEGQTLFVRGTVKDVHGALEDGAITVNGVEAELELNETKDEGTWSVTVDLQPGENIVEVTAIDVAKNANEEDKPSVRSRRVESIVGESFPDNENPFSSVFKVDIGFFDNELLAFVTDDSRQRPGVFAVNLATGKRTLVANNQGVEDELKFYEPQSIHFGENGKLYVSDYSSAIFEIDLANFDRKKLAEKGNGSYASGPLGMFLLEKTLFVADERRVYAVNVDTAEQLLVSSANEKIPDAQNPFDDIWGLTYEDGSIFVADYNGVIFSVDRTTGMRTLLSQLELTSTAVVDLAKGPQDGELIYLNRSSSQLGIYKFDIFSGKSELLSSSQSPDSINSPREVWGVSVHPSGGYLLLIDRARKAVYAVDMQQGYRVVISKSL